MVDNYSEKLLDLEEQAEGVELYRTPGSHLIPEEAREQAEAAGWIPSKSGSHRLTSLHRAKTRRQDLRAAIDYLEFVAAQPSSTKWWAEAVEAALLRLRGALIAHIEETEGPDGLLIQMVETAPQLSMNAHEMAAEHGKLLASADRALGILESSEAVDPRDLRRKVVSLLGRLATHRQRGADLVYDAYNVDIAAAD